MVKEISEKSIKEIMDFEHISRENAIYQIKRWS